MIINHNMSAINANRQMAANQSATAKSTEKLSSGLRINRAGDDAAGLAISEKMRAQISGLNQASRNAQDGISMIQTAEGALNETHSILQRMRELSVQSGNDTNTDADRVELQTEVEALAEEITRIGNSTEFNTQKLLNGEKTNNGATTVTVGQAAIIGKPATPGTPATTLAVDTEVLGSIPDATGGKVTAEGTYTGTADVTLTVKYDQANSKWQTSTDGNSFSDMTGNTATIDGITVDVSGYVTANASADGIFTVDLEVAVAGDDAVESADAVAGQFEFKVGNGDLTIDGVTITKENIVGKADTEIQTAIDAALNDGVAATNGKYAVTVQDGKVTLTQEAGEESATAPNITGAKDGSVSLQIGANSGQSISVAISDMRAEALSGDVKDADGNSINMSVADIDISTKEGAELGIQALDNAITTVSGQRSALGAIQNRLEHTINNLGTSSENLTAAESRIRDVDMAEEMMEFTKNNVLSQASQAMLAQAKALPNQVLSLLQ